MSVLFSLTSLQIPRYNFPWFLGFLLWDLPVLGSPESMLCPWQVFSCQEIGMVLGSWAAADADGYPLSGSDYVLPVAGDHRELSAIWRLESRSKVKTAVERRKCFRGCQCLPWGPQSWLCVTKLPRCATLSDHEDLSHPFASYMHLSTLAGMLLLELLTCNYIWLSSLALCSVHCNFQSWLCGVLIMTACAIILPPWEPTFHGPQARQ